MRYACLQSNRHTYYILNSTHYLYVSHDIRYAVYVVIPLFVFTNIEKEAQRDKAKRPLSTARLVQRLTTHRKTTGYAKTM